MFLKLIRISSFKILLPLALLSSSAFAATAHKQTWEAGYTFFAFFQKYNIPTSVYYNLSPKDRELTSEVYAGVSYYTLLDDSGELLQALIPIGDGMQIHIFKRDGEFALDFTPLIAFEQEQTVSLSIQRSPYQDLLEMTHDSGLVSEFLNAYKNSVNFRGIMKNDRLAVIYERKYRLGAPLKNANIKAAVVEINKKPHYLFRFKNGRYYNQEGKEIQGFLLQTPVSGARVSSKFSLGRKHPILGFVRPHYGVDLAVPKGTPIVAAADGVVSFAGKKGGYGNLIEIRHEGNLKTLYGHMNSFANGMRAGKKVKRGQMIGRVGTTGLSTGPHVHFGLYRNNVPINPLSNVKAVSKELAGKEKEAFNELVKEFTPILQKALEEGKNTIRANDSLAPAKDDEEEGDANANLNDEGDSSNAADSARPQSSQDSQRGALESNNTESQSAESAGAKDSQSVADSKQDSKKPSAQDSKNSKDSKQTPKDSKQIAPADSKDFKHATPAESQNTESTNKTKTQNARAIEASDLLHPAQSRADSKDSKASKDSKESKSQTDSKESQ